MQQSSTVRGLLETEARNHIRAIFAKGCVVQAGIIFSAAKATVHQRDEKVEELRAQGRLLQGIWLPDMRRVVTAAIGVEAGEQFGDGDPNRITPTPEEERVYHKALDALKSKRFMIALCAAGLALVVVAIAIVVGYEAAYAGTFWSYFLDNAAADTGESLGFGKNMLLLGVVLLGFFFHLWARRNEKHSVLIALNSIAIGLLIFYIFGMGAQLALDAYSLTNDAGSEDGWGESFFLDDAATVELEAKSPFEAVLKTVLELSYVGMIGYLIWATLLLHHLGLAAEYLFGQIRDRYARFELAAEVEDRIEAASDQSRAVQSQIDVFGSVTDEQLCDWLAGEIETDLASEIAKRRTELDSALIAKANIDAKPEARKAHKLDFSERPTPTIPAPTDDEIELLKKQIAELRSMDYEYFRTCIDNPKNPVPPEPTGSGPDSDEITILGQAA